MPEVLDTDFAAFQSPHEASVDRLVEAVDRAYHRPWLLMWRAFLQGLMTALGLTVGYAMIVILIAYLIQVRGGTAKLLDPLLIEVQQKVIQPTVQNQTNALTTQLSPSDSEALRRQFQTPPNAQ